MDFLIDRSILLVTHKKPFYDWLKKVEPDNFQAPTSIDKGVFFIPLIQKTSDENIEAGIRKYYPQIFIQELNGWFTDPNLWPLPFDYNMFKEWFEVEHLGMGVDLGKGPIRKEKLDEEIEAYKILKALRKFKP